MKPKSKPVVILYPEIADKISQMVKSDQEMRVRMQDDPKAYKSDIDTRNTDQLRKIVEEIGWPIFSKVGEEASGSAWLLIQHADHDVVFQEKCLKLMKKAPKKQIQIQNIAYLEDRVRINQEKPQIYGTQFELVGENDCKPKNLEDPKNVDKRRKSMGLNTIEEYKKEFMEFYQLKAKHHG